MMLTTQFSRIMVGEDGPVGIGPGTMLIKGLSSRSSLIAARPSAGEVRPE
jgi:hypothetical protein